MLTHFLFHVLFAVVSTLEQTERDQVPLPVDNGPPFSLTEDTHKFLSERQAVLLRWGGGISVIPPSDLGRQSRVTEIYEGSSVLVLWTVLNVKPKPCQSSGSLRELEVSSLI